MNFEGIIHHRSYIIYIDFIVHICCGAYKRGGRGRNSTFIYVFCHTLFYFCACKSQ